MQTLTFREDAPSYVPDIARLSAVTAIALSSLSNVAILEEGLHEDTYGVVPQYAEQFDIAGYAEVPVPDRTDVVAPHDAAQVLSEFVAKLATNMQSAPPEVHREVAQRPWDFV